MPANRRVSRRLLVLTAAGAIGGALTTSCTSKTRPAPSGQTQAEASEAPVDAPAPPTPFVTPVDAHGDAIVGHVVVPSASRLLTLVREQYAPPTLQGMLGMDFLRSTIAAGTGAPFSVVEHFGADAPAGCVASAPNGADSTIPTLTCGFSFIGGPSAFATELEADGRLLKPKDDGGGTLGRVYIGTVAATISASTSGEHVVLHFGEPLKDPVRTQARTYLETELLSREPAAGGALELTLFPDAIAANFSSFLQEMENEATETTQRESQEVITGATEITGASSEDALREFWDFLEALDHRLLYGDPARWRQATVYLDIKPDVSILGTALFPHDPATTEVSLVKGRTIDPGMLRKLPPRTVLAQIYNHDPARGYGLGLYSHNIVPPADADLDTFKTKFANAWSAVSGLDVAEIVESLDRHARESRQLYDGHAALVAWLVADNEPAFALIQRMRPGQSGREAWTRWTHEFQPHRTLGENLTPYVDWTFIPRHRTIDSAPVDRWTITANPKLRQEIGSLPEGAAVASYTLHIDRVEHLGHALYIGTFNGSEAAIRQALAGVAETATDRAPIGDGHAVVPGNAAGSHVFSYLGSPNDTLQYTQALVGKSPEFLDFVRPILEALEKSPESETVTTGSIALRNWPGGAVTLELAVGQPFIDVVKRGLEQ